MILSFLITICRLIQRHIVNLGKSGHFRNPAFLHKGNVFRMEVVSVISRLGLKFHRHAKFKFRLGADLAQYFKLFDALDRNDSAAAAKVLTQALKEAAEFIGKSKDQA